MHRADLNSNADRGTLSSVSGAGAHGARGRGRHFADRGLRVPGTGRLQMFPTRLVLSSLRSADPVRGSPRGLTLSMSRGIEVRISKRDRTIPPRAIGGRFTRALAPNAISCFHLDPRTLMTACPSDTLIRACASAQIHRPARMWGSAFIEVEIGPTASGLVCFGDDPHLPASRHARGFRLPGSVL